MGGDLRALESLVRTFRSDAPKKLAGIRRAVLASDARALRAAAHALKGAVSNFAAAERALAPAATEAAARLQRMGEGGEMSEAPSALAELERELAAVSTALDGLVRGGPRKRPRRGKGGKAKPPLSRGT